MVYFFEICTPGVFIWVGFGYDMGVLCFRAFHYYSLYVCCLCS